MSKQKGDLAEEIAIDYLVQKNFKIVHKNFFAKKLGEIDIVAYQDKVLNFIEVKSGEGEPIYNITPSKLSKIIRSVDYYLQKYSIIGAYQIDAVIVKDYSLDNRVELIENITI